MLAGPSSRIQQLENLVGAARDCSNFDSLPKLGFKIGNKILNLDPDDYMDTSDNDCTLSSMEQDLAFGSTLKSCFFDDYSYFLKHSVVRDNLQLSRFARVLVLCDTLFMFLMIAKALDVLPPKGLLKGKHRLVLVENGVSV
ncbi:unnamed protein product [Polarella glacialis]|uniref:Uncharacterized protein n=1 Tax=Polarella glacialis TaxID=89957 RepID=A0A813F4B5_POLGL|nr:unnamed protein product [Polarella glacialis]